MIVRNINTNLTGEITIICGFPCIGKTKFAEGMQAATKAVTYVEDFDIDDFRAANPQLSGDEVYDQYVNEIIAKYRNLIDMRYKDDPGGKTILEMISAEDSVITDHNFKTMAETYPATAFILVSSHEEVRRRLSEKQVLYYYARPTIHQLDYFIGLAKDRAEKNPDDASAQREYAFMRDKAADAIKNDFCSDNQMDILIDFPVHLELVLDEMTDYFTLSEYNLHIAIVDMASALIGTGEDLVSTFPDITLDSHGRLIMRSIQLSEEMLSSLMASCEMPKRMWVSSAYNHKDFITLSRGDGEALFKLLTDAAKALKGTTESREAFGSDGISYERLYDRLVGCSYQLWPKDDDDEDTEESD